MTLYDAIFFRRSVRKYDKSPLDKVELDEIKKYIESIKQIDGLGARFEFATAQQVNDGKAPHYILAYAKASKAEYINIGYVLEKLDLFLQSRGYGSVWLGIPVPKSKKDDYVIMMGFGKTDVPIRKDMDEFKRLSVAEISSEDNNISRAARLAPSAVNSQPWKLKFYDSKVTVEYFGRGMIQRLLRAKMSMIDLGIIARFVELALEKEGKKVKSITPTVGQNIFVEIAYE